MNLLQKIKSTFFSTDAQAAPEPASFATRSSSHIGLTSLLCFFSMRLAIARC